MPSSVTHAMADGARLSISGEADLSSPISRFARVSVSALGRAHPFELQPSGFTYRMQEQPPPLPEGTEIGQIHEFNIKGGLLRLAQVVAPHPYGWTRYVTIAGWEGATGCIWTAKSHGSIEEMLAIYDSVEFVESSEGVYFISPVESDIRTPLCLKEIPDVALLEIRPMSQTVLDRLPTEPGISVEGGSLYRINEASAALLLTTPSAIVAFDPLNRDDQAGTEVMALATTLTFDWGTPPLH